MSIGALLHLPPDVCRAVGGVLPTLACALMALLAFYWNDLAPWPRTRAPQPRNRPDDKLR